MTHTMGKKVCYGGEQVYVKPDCEDARFRESLNKLYVEMDFAVHIAR